MDDKVNDNSVHPETDGNMGVVEEDNDNITSYNEAVVEDNTNNDYASMDGGNKSQVKNTRR